jgi:hypothetical protein
MSVINTVLHQRLFNGLIKRAPESGHDADEAAYAILYAALAAAQRQLGADQLREDLLSYINHPDFKALARRN